MHVEEVNIFIWFLLFIVNKLSNFQSYVNYVDSLLFMNESCWLVSLPKRLNGIHYTGTGWMKVYLFLWEEKVFIGFTLACCMHYVIWSKLSYLIFIKFQNILFILFKEKFTQTVDIYTPLTDILIYGYVALNTYLDMLVDNAYLNLSIVHVGEFWYET